MKNDRHVQMHSRGRAYQKKVKTFLQYLKKKHFQMNHQMKRIPPDGAISGTTWSPDQGPTIYIVGTLMGTKFKRKQLDTLEIGPIPITSISNRQ